MPSTFTDLRVWKEAMELVVRVYQGTAEFPRDEIYGLRSQIRRAAVSVPSNIAEGKGHHSDREFRQYLFRARGSLLELQTQLMIAQALKFIPEETAGSLLRKCATVGRSLNGLIRSLEAQSTGAS